MGGRPRTAEELRAAADELDARDKRKAMGKALAVKLREAAKYAVRGELQIAVDGARDAIASVRPSQTED